MKTLFCSVIGLLALAFSSCVVVGPPHGRAVGNPHRSQTVVVVPEPRLVFVPEYSIYVAADVESDLFFDGSVWFHFSNGVWYRGAGYDGPWVVVKKGLPPGLTKVPPGQLKKRAMKVKGNEGKGPGKGRGRPFE
jgi:hypothetical protein